VSLRPTARHLAAATVSALALATVAVGAVAATSGSGSSPRAAASTTITACVGVRTGAMRLETAAKPCVRKGKKSKRERRVSWDQEGPTGATGPAGGTGPVGPAGPSGAPGAAASERALAAGEFTASAPVAAPSASFAALPFDDNQVLRHAGVATGDYRGLTAEAVAIQETGTYRVSLTVTLDPDGDPLSPFTFVSARLLDQPDDDFSNGLVAVAAVSGDIFPAAAVDRTVHLDAGDLVAPVIESDDYLDDRSFLTNVGVSFTVEQLD
jgi:hypothetical protein